MNQDRFNRIIEGLNAGHRKIMNDCETREAKAPGTGWASEQEEHHLGWFSAKSFQLHQNSRKPTKNLIGGAKVLTTREQHVQVFSNARAVYYDLFSDHPVPKLKLPKLG